MRKVNFFSFLLLLALGIATVVLNSCGKDKEDNTNFVTVNEGVVINGVKWATCNVAAPGTFTAKPEDAGMFYQWNRKKAWSATGDVTNWDSSTPTGDAWEKPNDPSPAGWRVPTLVEIQTLFDTDKVKNKWISQKNGIEFTDIITGNTLFLPAAGFRDDDGTLYYVGFLGDYWSSTAIEFGDWGAYDMYFDSDYADWDSVFSRNNGLSIRSVAE